MASSTFSPKLPSFHTTNQSKHQNVCSSKHFRCKPQQQIRRRRAFSVQALASSAIALPVNVDYLKTEFSGHGVSFEHIGDSCVVKMELENGSTANLMLPSGLITSYKPSMWHGARTEVLHTLVSEGEDGRVIIQGGVSTDIRCISDGGFTSSSNKWSLLDVRGSSDQAIQVELVSNSPVDMVETKCVVTLQKDLLGSEITVTNQGSTSLQLSGSVVSHLTVSTPDATYVVGLQGSSYHNKQPMVSDFNIIPQSSRGEKPVSLLASKGFDALFSGWDKRGQDCKEGSIEDGEEQNEYASMREKMCRIYTSAPRELTVIDRGKRNSVVVQRSGFDELYVYSPGSDHDWYGKYAYICVGPSAVLKPVTLGPGAPWTGAQYLYNPNL